MIRTAALQEIEHRADLAHAQFDTLPALVDRASKMLASARNAAEVLEAREVASAAYDVAKLTARLARAKGAHDELLSKIHRAQADALDLEAQAKRRLADEYDAAQERGEVAKHGQKRADIPDGNISDDIGISAKEIHEGRILNDAEAADPGIVRRALDEQLKGGREPTKASLRQIVSEAAVRGLRGGSSKPDRRNPIYEAPSAEFSAMLAVSSACRDLMNEVRGTKPAAIMAGFVDAAQRSRNLAAIRECRDFLSSVLQVADAQ